MPTKISAKPLNVMFRETKHTWDVVTCLKSYPSPQPFSSGRQVVVERHSRDSGLRKEWQSGSNSQERTFPDNRRIDSRGSLMGSSRYSTFRHKSLYWRVLSCELQAVLFCLQSLVIWTKQNCTDHQQLHSQWWQHRRVQVLQRNAAAVLAAAIFCKMFLNSLFLG